ncbi:unnamed protein product, partial [marine sediment metagenome]
MLEKPIAYYVTQVLKKVIESGTGRGANIGRPAAGKTGTTDGPNDAWFAGYTPELVTVVWMGYLELLNGIGGKDRPDINFYLGFNFNLFNSLSLVFFNDIMNLKTTLKGIEFSPELNLEEILKIISNVKNLFKDEIEFSIFGHGYFPVMNSR